MLKIMYHSVFWITITLRLFKKTCTVGRESKLKYLLLYIFLSLTLLNSLIYISTKNMWFVVKVLVQPLLVSLLMVTL